MGSSLHEQGDMVNNVYDNERQSGGKRGALGRRKGA